MNYRTSTMQKSNNWRAPSDGSVAHKLLSIELEHHHETQSLRREIKRLRAEVGLMARLRNFHKAQTDRLADILRKLPPPDIPTRNIPEVADPLDPQNDTTMEERGRPRTREENGSDKSTSREDGKQRTKEKGEGAEEDRQMTDVCDHTIGESRNDTSSAPPSAAGPTTSPKTIVPAYIHRKPEGQTGHSRNGSRTRAVSVVSTLRKSRSITKSPAPPNDKQTTAAKKERRKEKELTRTAAQNAKRDQSRKRKEEEEKTKLKEWDRFARMLEKELAEDEEDMDTGGVEDLKEYMNEITTKWEIVDGRCRRLK